MEFEIKFNELLKPSQQNGFHLSQVVILADEIESPKYGKLIRISPLYQVHNFTTGQKHYNVSLKDIFINTNIDSLNSEPNSVILIQNSKPFTEIPKGAALGELAESARLGKINPYLNKGDYLVSYVTDAKKGNYYVIEGILN